MQPIDFLFVDTQRLTSYLEQTGHSTTTDRKRTWSASLSLTGPRFDLKNESTIRDKMSHEKILALIEEIDALGLLDRERPKNMQYTGKPFCLEATVATKVILPQANLASIGLKEFAVWVAEPNETDLSNQEFRAGGTFLYLTEAFWDSDPYHGIYSGCSALRALVNIYQGKQLIDRGEDWVRHPVAKLTDLGGVAAEPRRIVSLYRKRYMTDEVFLAGGRGQGHRCFDLLAYPIFIADPLTIDGEYDLTVNRN